MSLATGSTFDLAQPSSGCRAGGRSGSNLALSYSSPCLALTLQSCSAEHRALIRYGSQTPN
eukprot:2769623-Amphidinium_carterae.1